MERPIMNGNRARPFLSEAGFTYLTVMAAIFIVGILTTQATAPWRTAKKIDREEELLFRGKAIRDGIEAYYKTAHAGISLFPERLEDLVEAKNGPGGRYLRKLYKDPITGGDWELIYSGGRIRGVHSKSEEEPLKQGNFPKTLKPFENKSRYSDWIFEFDPAAPREPG